MHLGWAYHVFNYPSAGSVAPSAMSSSGCKRGHQSRREGPLPVGRASSNRAPRMGVRGEMNARAKCAYRKSRTAFDTTPAPNRATKRRGPMSIPVIPPSSTVARLRHYAEAIHALGVAPTFYLLGEIIAGSSNPAHHL